MSAFGQRVRKLVKLFIPQRKPKVQRSTITLPEPERKLPPRSKRHERPRGWWLHRRSRLHMTRASRRGNR